LTFTGHFNYVSLALGNIFTAYIPVKLHCLFIENTLDSCASIALVVSDS